MSKFFNLRRPTIASSSQPRQAGQKGLLSRLTTAESSFGNADPSRVDAWMDTRHKSWLPIHPDSIFRMFWDLIIFVFIVYTTWATPIRIAFADSSDSDGTNWLFLDFGVDCIFIIDIILNFNTGYVSTDIADYVVLDPVAIRKRYLRSWFLIDFLACLPIDFVVYYVTLSLQNQATTEILNFILVLRLIKLVKLLRLLKLKNMIEDWEEKFFSLTFNPGVRRLLSIMFWVLILSHINACSWYFLAAVLDDGSNDTWANTFARDLKDRHDVNSLYLMSFYWSVVTLTSVGYGDITPVNNAERFYCILASFVGASVFGYIIGHMSSIVANLNQANTVFQNRMDAINSYLRYRRVPVELQFRVRRYFKYYIERKTVFDEKQILEDLSHQLRVELSTFLIQDVFQNMELFQDITDPIFLSKIVTMLKPLSAAPGDVIIREGQIGMEMYLLIRGSVEVVSGDGRLVYAVLGPGTHFGEIGTMDLKPERRTASVRAIEHCEMFSLSREDLFQVSHDFPEVARNLNKMAAERVIISKNLRTQIKVQRLAAGKAVDLRKAKLGKFPEEQEQKKKGGSSRIASDFILPNLWNVLPNRKGGSAKVKPVHQPDNSSSSQNNSERRYGRKSRNRSLILCDIDHDAEAQMRLVQINSDLIDKETKSSLVHRNETEEVQGSDSDFEIESDSASSFDMGEEMQLPGNVPEDDDNNSNEDVVNMHKKNVNHDRSHNGSSSVFGPTKVRRSSTVSSHFADMEQKLKNRSINKPFGTMPAFARVGTIPELLHEDSIARLDDKLPQREGVATNELSSRVCDIQNSMDNLEQLLMKQATQIQLLTNAVMQPNASSTVRQLAVSINECTGSSSHLLARKDTESPDQVKSKLPTENNIIKKLSSGKWSTASNSNGDNDSAIFIRNRNRSLKGSVLRPEEQVDT